LHYKFHSDFEIQKPALACFVFDRFVVQENDGRDVLGVCVAMHAALLPLRVWTFLLVGILSATLLMIHRIEATFFSKPSREYC
jgi:hypothetical protein